MNFSALVFLPVMCFGVLSAVSIIALHSSPGRRLWYLPLLSMFGCLSFYNLHHWPSWYGIDSLWGLHTTIYFMHITSVLYVEKYVLGREEQCNRHYTTSNSSWNFRAACRIWNNPRRVGLAEGAEPPQRMRSWPVMILTRSFRLAVCWLLVYIADAILTTFFRPFSIADFSYQKETYLRRLLLSTEGVTTRETMLRLVLGTHWILVAYVLLESAHYLLTIFFVALLRMDEIEAWPPLFGNLTMVCSVSSFWGKFWHRIVYKPYKSYARLLSRQVLGLKANSRSEKTFVSFCMFFFSGLAHSLVSWRLGSWRGVWRDTAWFLVNFGTCGFEIMLRNWLPKFASRQGYEEDYRRFAGCLGAKFVGFVWVWLFFAWSVPKWQYPRIYCAMLEHSAGYQRDISVGMFGDLTDALNNG